jgi:cysteine desulfuration protein SufE
VTEAATTDYATIAENLAVLDDWEDRYRYVIDLGRALPALPDAERTEATRVQGCSSQVWLVSEPRGEPPALHLRGDSDALIVRGLVAIAIAMHDGRSAADILAFDALKAFADLGLKEHLSVQRSNGLVSMIGRIRRDAEAALAAA